MYKLLFLSLTAWGVLAGDLSLIHFGRQIIARSTCQISEQVCGSGCIPATDTCCPDGSGGCPVTEFCELGSNNQYGCCPNGQVCTGAGGGQSCSSQGQKDCGSGCIDLSWTCCPDQSGGCDSTEYCTLGSNNQYGCCPNGQVCTGSGGGGGGGGGGNATCAAQGQIDCGSGCIDSTWTCCPDQSGGCGPTDYCELGSNNQYGCCANGQVCVGNGGVSTSGIGGGGGGGGGSTAGQSQTDIVGTTAIETSTPIQTQPVISTTPTPVVTTPIISTTPLAPTLTTAPTTPSRSIALPTTTSPLPVSANEGYKFSSSPHILGVILATLFIFF